MEIVFLFAALAASCQCGGEKADGLNWNSADGECVDGVATVTQECAVGTGTVTRVCKFDKWKDVDVSNCKTTRCKNPPADFTASAHINNGATKVACPSGSSDGFECEAVCANGYIPVSVAMICEGGQWKSYSSISCGNTLQQDAAWSHVSTIVIGIIVILSVGAGIIYHMMKQPADNDAVQKCSMVNGSSLYGLQQTPAYGSHYNRSGHASRGNRKRW